MHQQLPGWRSLIKSIVGRVYANVAKSKQASLWIVTSMDALWIGDQYFIPDFVPPLLHPRHLRAPSTHFYCWFQAALHVPPPQHVAAHNLSAKGEVSFPLVWIGRFVREKKQRIISAVAEGCREVVWHRHWLSLLRSEGILRLREKKKKKGKERSEWANEQNCKLDWMRCKCPGDALAFYLFISFVFCNILFRLDQQTVMLS